MGDVVASALETFREKFHNVKNGMPKLLEEFEWKRKKWRQWKDFDAEFAKRGSSAGGEGGKAGSAGKNAGAWGKDGSKGEERAKGKGSIIGGFAQRSLSASSKGAAENGDGKGKSKSKVSAPQSLPATGYGAWETADSNYGEGNGYSYGKGGKANKHADTASSVRRSRSPWRSHGSANSSASAGSEAAVRLTENRKIRPISAGNANAHADAGRRPSANPSLGTASEAARSLLRLTENMKTRNASAGSNHKLRTARSRSPWRKGGAQAGNGSQGSSWQQQSPDSTWSWH